MTITSLTNRVSYTSPGGTGPYDLALTFAVQAQTDLEVYAGTLKLTNGWSLSADGTKVTLTGTLPASGTVVTVIRRALATQTTDYSGPVRYDDQERAIDRATMVSQDIRAELAQTLHTAPTDDQTVNMTIPAKATRAGCVLAFDTNGAPVAGAQSSHVVVAENIALGASGLLLKVADTGGPLTIEAASVQASAVESAVSTVATHTTTINSHTLELADHEGRIGNAEVKLNALDVVGGDLIDVSQSGNVWTVSLTGDLVSSPSAAYYYGTNSAGTFGMYSLPTSGGGSIDPGSITYDKVQNQALGTVLGRLSTDAAGPPRELSAANVRTLIGVNTAGGVAGLDGTGVVAAAQLPANIVNPTQASSPELTAGTLTSLRSYSPADIKEAVLAHAPSGGSIDLGTVDYTSTNATIVNPSGADPTIAAVTKTTAGVMAADDYVRLNYVSRDGTRLPTSGHATGAFDTGTRVFTVTAGGTYEIWCGGEKRSINTDRTVTVPNSTGYYYIGLDSTGTLVASTTDPFLSGPFCMLYHLYFNTTGPVSLIFDARYPHDRPMYLDDLYTTFMGPMWRSGLVGSSFGNGGTFSFTAGTFNTGARTVTVSGTQTQGARVYRLSGGSWTIDSAASSTTLTTGGALAYDASGTVTAVTTNNYTNLWVFAVSTSPAVLHVLVGQAEYATQVAAEAESLADLVVPTWLQLDGRALYRLTYQRTAGVPTGLFISSLDLRTFTMVGGKPIARQQAATVLTATTSANGLMSAADKSKLDGVEALADVTDATNVAAAGAVMTSRTVSTTAPVTGGGALSSDLTIAVSAATTSAAGTMSAVDKTAIEAIKPLILNQAGGDGRLWVLGREAGHATGDPLVLMDAVDNLPTASVLEPGLMSAADWANLFVSRGGFLSSGWESPSSYTTLGFNYSTRVLTLQIVTTYYYWANGQRLTGTANKTVTLPATTGFYYITLDSTGALQASTTHFLLTPELCPVAAVYYLSTAAVSLVIDRKIPITVPSSVASFMTHQAGPWVVPGGFDATFGSTDGSFSIAAGSFVVNSVEFTRATAFTSATRLRRGSGGDWTLLSSSADIRPNNGTNLAYDNGTGLTACTVDYYSVCAVFIVPLAVTGSGGGGPTLHAVMGQAQYATLADAEAVRIDNFTLPVWLEQYGRLLSIVIYQRTAGTPGGVYVEQLDSRLARTVNGKSVGGAVTVTTTGGGGSTVSVDSIDFDDKYLGTPIVSATIGFHVVPVDCTLQTNLVGSVCVCGTTASATTVFSINHNGTPIGSITFSSGDPDGVFSGSLTALALGDSLSIVAPAALNGIANIAWNIQGVIS